MSLRSFVLLCALCALVGCAQTVTVRAPVDYPARVPVRAFPTILIAGADLPEGDLAERLRAHLAKGGERDVRKIDVKELEPMREAGALTPLSIVITLEAEIESDQQEQWEMVPMPICTGFGGCFTDFQPVYSNQPRVLGDLLLTVYEGPTARVLQRERFQVILDAPNTKAMRTRVFEQLARELTFSVDVLRSDTYFELEPVEQPSAAREGVERMRRGDFREGRVLLEQAAKQLGGHDKRTQARVWYDLAIARWQAPGPQGLTQAAFESARRALTLAISLEDGERYRPVLARLESARRRQAVLEAQRMATQHNFALKAAVPEPR